MERVFQRMFKHRHYHIIGHTGGPFQEENTIAAVEVFPAVKTLKTWKVIGCDEIRPEKLTALNRGVPWLTRVCQDLQSY